MPLCGLSGSRAPQAAGAWRQRRGAKRRACTGGLESSEAGYSIGCAQAYGVAVIAAGHQEREQLQGTEAELTQHARRILLLHNLGKSDTLTLTFLGNGSHLPLVTASL